MKFCKIKKISKSKSKPVYHLTVEKNHNFIANNLCVHNCGYRGEICCLMINHGQQAYMFKKGRKVAQAVIAKVEHPNIEVVEELSDSKRGDGGFGSTGI